MYKTPKKLLLLVLLSAGLVACNQDQKEQQTQSNLDAPEVVSKSTNKALTSHGHLSPLSDANDPGSMIIGYNQSINSFAPMQCFTYSQQATTLSTNDSLSASYTSEDIQKKLGVDSSVKIKIDTFHISDKSDITQSSSYASNSIRVYYTANIGATVKNQITGLTAQGEALFKQGLPQFASQCGSAFVNSFEGNYTTIFYFDIASSDSKTMKTIKNTAKMKVSFLQLMNTVNSSQQSNNSSVTITAGLANYGGTLKDAGQISSITSGLLANPDLGKCIGLGSNSNGACETFITTDISNALSKINTVVSAEAADKDLSGMYPDFSTVTNNITQITGAMIGHKTTKAIADPYKSYPLLKVSNVAEDLSIASSNSSALLALVNTANLAGGLISSLQFVPGQLASNVKAYDSAATPLWVSLSNCLSGINNCATISQSTSVVNLLANQPIALQALYNQAYAIDLVSFASDSNTNATSSVPMILVNNNNNAYVFSPATPNTSGTFVLNNINNIESLNYNFQANTDIDGKFFGSSQITLYFANVDPDNIFTSKALGCTLLNVSSGASCQATILPFLKSGSLPQLNYLSMSVNNPFTTVTQTQ